jgi:hypothetical protein
MARVRSTARVTREGEEAEATETDLRSHETIGIGYDGGSY